MMKLYFLLGLWLTFSDPYLNFKSRTSAKEDKHNKLPRLSNFTEAIRQGGRKAGVVGRLDTDNGSFLRIIKPMKNQSATSGDTVTFQCKVDGWPNQDIQYTWYVEDEKIDNNFDYRFTITTRPWGSRLRIKDLYTSDSGVYRCEASNGIQKVHTSSMLTVTFAIPQLPTNEEAPIINFPRGKCEVYEGESCRAYFGGMKIYVDAFENQKEMDHHLQITLQQISNTSYVTKKCRRFAFPAVCYFIFVPCHVGDNGDIERGERLCKEDCKLLKRDICHKEYLQSHNNLILKELFDTANCSLLPSTLNSKCTRVNIPFLNEEDDCYYEDGEGYRGKINTALSGDHCQTWPVGMATIHSELFGGHNFCRNPGKSLNTPWCYIDERKTKRMSCNITKCTNHKKLDTKINVYIHIVIPCICFIVLLFCILAGYCLCRRNRKKRTKIPKKDFGEKLPLTQPLLVCQTNLPLLKEKSVEFEYEIGSGCYGTMFKGFIINDSRFSSKEPVAIKTFKVSCNTSYLEAFKNEIEVLSLLNHPSITNVKAWSIQTGGRCLLFEYNDNTVLHQYLTQNHDTATILSNTDRNFEHEFIGNYEFLQMAIQIASGMEYLTSHNFIHRDLAARNILVCGNMELKICNLGVVRDSYLSSYYRSPQGGQMLPIRWMAPESLQSWEFSGKSSVWSFGVLLWEMFSYGLQPYCGYSNHEVLDIISRRQLLACPDQCPAKIYSLMHECWIADAQLRPHFKDIHMKLKVLLSENYLRSSSSRIRTISVPPKRSPSSHRLNNSLATRITPSWNERGTLSEKSLSNSVASCLKSEPSNERDNPSDAFIILPSNQKHVSS